MAQDNNAALFEKWISQAEFDLKAAKNSVKSGDFEWACFQIQQAGEKALKAFLMLKGKRGIVSHSVYFLLKECESLDKRFSALAECKALDHYYISARYPDGLPDDIPHNFFQKEDAGKCVSIAGKLLFQTKKLAGK